MLSVEEVVDWVHQNFGDLAKVQTNIAAQYMQLEGFSLRGLYCALLFNIFTWTSISRLVVLKKFGLQTVDLLDTLTWHPEQESILEFTKRVLSRNNRDCTNVLHAFLNSELQRRHNEHNSYIKNRLESNFLEARKLVLKHEEEEKDE